MLGWNEERRRFWFKGDARLFVAEGYLLSLMVMRGDLNPGEYDDYSRQLHVQMLQASVDER